MDEELDDELADTTLGFLLNAPDAYYHSWHPRYRRRLLAIRKLVRELSTLVNNATQDESEGDSGRRNRRAR